MLTLVKKENRAETKGNDQKNEYQLMTEKEERWGRGEREISLFFTLQRKTGSGDVTAEEELDEKFGNLSFSLVIWGH